LLDSEGVPEGCLLSVRAGSTRRQAPAEKNKPFWFPRGTSFALPLKVDLLAPLGSATLDLNSRSDSYDVEILPPEGSAGTKTSMRVNLRVREDSAPAEVRSSSYPSGAGPASGAAASLIDHAIGPSPQSSRSVPGATTSQASSSRRHLMALAARTYLEEHNLFLWVQTLLQDLIRDKPVDPWKYIEVQLGSAKKGIPSDQKAEPGRPVGGAEETTGEAAEHDGGDYCGDGASPGPGAEAAGMVALSSFAKAAVAGEIPALLGTKAATQPSNGDSPATRELQMDLSKPSGDPPGQPATARSITSTVISAATGKDSARDAEHQEAAKAILVARAEAIAEVEKQRSSLNDGELPPPPPPARGVRSSPRPSSDSSVDTLKAKAREALHSELSEASAAIAQTQVSTEDALRQRAQTAVAAEAIGTLGEEAQEALRLRVAGVLTDATLDGSLTRNLEALLVEKKAAPDPSAEAAGMVALSKFANAAVAGEIPALLSTKASPEEGSSTSKEAAAAEPVRRGESEDRLGELASFSFETAPPSASALPGERSKRIAPGSAMPGTNSTASSCCTSPATTMRGGWWAPPPKTSVATWSMELPVLLERAAREQDNPRPADRGGLAEAPAITSEQLQAAKLKAQSALQSAICSDLEAPAITPEQLQAAKLKAQSALQSAICSDLEEPGTAAPQHGGGSLDTNALTTAKKKAQQSLLASLHQPSDEARSAPRIEDEAAVPVRMKPSVGTWYMHQRAEAASPAKEKTEPKPDTFDIEAVKKMARSALIVSLKAGDETEHPDKPTGQTRELEIAAPQPGGGSADASALAIAKKKAQQSLVASLAQPSDDARPSNLINDEASIPSRMKPSVGTWYMQQPKRDAVDAAYVELRPSNDSLENKEPAPLTSDTPAASSVEPPAVPTKSCLAGSDPKRLTKRTSVEFKMDAEVESQGEEEVRPRASRVSLQRKPTGFSKAALDSVNDEEDENDLENNVSFSEAVDADSGLEGEQQLTPTKRSLMRKPTGFVKQISCGESDNEENSEEARTPAGFRLQRRLSFEIPAGTIGELVIRVRTMVYTSVDRSLRRSAKKAAQAGKGGVIRFSEEEVEEEEVSDSEAPAKVDRKRAGTKFAGSGEDTIPNIRFSESEVSDSEAPAELDRKRAGTKFVRSGTNTIPILAEKMHKRPSFANDVEEIESELPAVDSIERRGSYRSQRRFSAELPTIVLAEVIRLVRRNFYCKAATHIESAADDAVANNAVVKMTVQNINYPQLAGDAALLLVFEQVVRKEIAAAAGGQITSEHVCLTLSAGSVVVRAVVTPPDGKGGSTYAGALARKLGTAPALAENVAQKLSAVDGIAAVSTGQITVTGVETAVEATGASSEVAKAACSPKARLPGSSTPFSEGGLASVADLESKIRARNDRFRCENDALRRENQRLKGLRYKGDTSGQLSSENELLRSELGRLASICGSKKKLGAGGLSAPTAGQQRSGGPKVD